MSKAPTEAQATLRSATQQAEDAPYNKNADVTSLQTKLASMELKISERNLFYENRINELLSTLQSVKLLCSQLRHREDALLKKFAISETQLNHSKSNEEEIACILNSTQAESDFRVQNLTKMLNEAEQKSANLQEIITSKDRKLRKFKENLNLLEEKMVTKQNRSEKLAKELNEVKSSNKILKKAIAEEKMLVEDLNGKVFISETGKQHLEEKCSENQKQVGFLHEALF